MNQIMTLGALRNLRKNNISLEYHLLGDVVKFVSLTLDVDEQELVLLTNSGVGFYDLKTHKTDAT